MENIGNCQDRVVTSLNLSTNGGRILEFSDEADKKMEIDAQRALDETGFGKFNYKIIIVSGMICTNLAFVISSVGFILPSAACDFDMDTISKGQLSAAPILGMLLGSCVWGSIADTKGRRPVLLNCLLLQGAFECLASVVPNYWGFIIFKFLSGLALSGQLAVLYTYVGEFQPENYREKILSFMEIPWVIGIIIAPLIAWITIPLNINLTISSFYFKSWNLYVALCSLPAFVVCILLARLPETPKYLAQKNRYRELQNVLADMYCANTGKKIENYVDKLRSMEITFWKDRSNDSVENLANKSENILKVFRNFFITLYRQTVMLFKAPYIGTTLLICLGSYCIFSSLYTLMLWFPELFKRFADFEEQYPGESASVCIVAESATNLKKNGTMTFPEVGDVGAAIDCKSTMQTQVFVHTSILAVSCIPAAVAFCAGANFFGFRFYFVFNSFACGAVTIGLLFVTTSTENLILSCIYEALMSVCTTALFCISVELFPTHLRVTGSSIASLFGRIGALSGNAMFGYLIDDHCITMISIVAVQLFLAGVSGIFMTKSSNSKS